MVYGGPRDLKSQLIAFAAQRAISKVIDVAARHAEKQVTNQVRKSSRNKLKSQIQTKVKDKHMAVQNAQRVAQFVPRNERNNQNNDQDRGPIEFWVNTVFVEKDGAEPLRLTPGRPLNSFRADKQTTTNSEELNMVNALNNSFIRHLREDAEKLELGQSKYYSPAGCGEEIEVDGEKVVSLKAGIYFQLHRDKTDHDAAAAEAMDIEAEATATLRKLFS